jgi:hypothetical protein
MLKMFYHVRSHASEIQRKKMVLLCAQAFLSAHLRHASVATKTAV